MANIEIFGTLVRNDGGTNKDKIVQGVQVEGGYFVCSTKPTTGTWQTGQLCYCTGDFKFYQYNGTQWIEKEFGTTAEATTESPGLMSAEDKTNLDTLTEMLTDGETTVDTIREVLDVFKEYPEETTIVNALAGKASATHTHTTVHKPEGTVSRPTFTGTEAGHTHAFSGSASHDHSFTGTGTVIKGTFTGTEQTTSVTYIPAGTVSTPTITVTPNTTTVNPIIEVGTLPLLTYSEVKSSKITAWSPGSVPSLTYSAVEASKVTDWSAGTAPSLTFSQGSLPSATVTEGSGSASLTGSVPTGPNRTVTLTLNHTHTASSFEFSSGTLPTATFNEGTLPSLTYSKVDAANITAWAAGSVPSLTYEEVAADTITEWSAGSLPTKGSDTIVVTGIKSAASSQPTFSGTEATISHKHTPSGTVTISTGAPGSGETANYTPAGTLSSKSVSISGTTGETKITPAGTVSQPTFTGTEATLTTSVPNS